MRSYFWRLNTLDKTSSTDFNFLSWFTVIFQEYFDIRIWPRKGTRGSSQNQQCKPIVHPVVYWVLVRIVNFCKASWFKWLSSFDLFVHTNRSSGSTTSPAVVRVIFILFLYSVWCPACWPYNLNILPLDNIFPHPVFFI